MMADLAVAVISDMIGRSFTESVFFRTSVFTPIPAPIAVAFFLFIGLYQVWGLSLVDRLHLRALGVLAFSAVNVLMLMFSFTIESAVATACIAVLLFVIGHYVEALVRTFLIRCGFWGLRTALIGDEKCEGLASELLAHPEFGLRPVVLITEYNEANYAGHKFSVPIVGRSANIAQLGFEIDIVLAAAKGSVEEGRDLIVQFPSADIVLYQPSDVQGTSGAVPISLAGETIGLYIRRDIYKRGNLLVKRMFDILVSLPLLVMAMPIIIALVLLIKVIDPGPGFFRQQRVGHNGRPIEVIKLRTMYINAEMYLQEYLERDPQARTEWEQCFKLSRDPRILPFIGKFMRRSSLDELPQLVNVLLGHMSLVGPRPFPSYHLDAFDEDFRNLRASVPPGLTGFWQISSRSDGDLSVQKTQDSFYVKNWSFWMDLWILLQTLPAILLMRGAR